MLNTRMIFLFMLVLVLCNHFTMSAPTLKHAICGEEHSKAGGSFVCLAYFPSWSYNADHNECVEFIYGGCNGNNNRFETQDECEEKCKL